MDGEWIIELEFVLVLGQRKDFGGRLAWKNEPREPGKGKSKTGTGLHTSYVRSTN